MKLPRFVQCHSEHTLGGGVVSSGGTTPPKHTPALTVYLKNEIVEQSLHSRTDPSRSVQIPLRPEMPSSPKRIGGRGAAPCQNREE